MILDRTKELRATEHFPFAPGVPSKACDLFILCTGLDRQVSTIQPDAIGIDPVEAPQLKQQDEGRLRLLAPRIPDAHCPDVLELLKTPLFLHSSHERGNRVNGVKELRRADE